MTYFIFLVRYDNSYQLTTDSKPNDVMVSIQGSEIFSEIWMDWVFFSLITYIVVGIDVDSDFGSSQSL